MNKKKSHTKRFTYKKGASCRFLGNKYFIKNHGRKHLRLGDEVIIHPIAGRSQTTRSFPARIDIVEYAWDEDNITTEISLHRIRGNAAWSGALINAYAMSRLEFVKRGDIRIHKSPRKLIKEYRKDLVLEAE